MFNYAFIVNSEKQDPNTYSAEYSNDSFKFYIAATNGLQATKELAKELGKQGVEMIDLCGDFDASDANKISSISGVDIFYAKYMPEELGKLDELTALSEYGIVVMGEGMDGRIETLRLESDEFNTTVKLVDTDENAKKAALELVDGGISFIELCSYFDVPKTKDIIKAIGGKVPVGYCG